MSTKQSLTDAGVGRALFTTKFRLSLQAATMCFSFGALPAFVIPLVLWFCLTSPFDLDLVKFEVISRIVPEASLHRWRFREDQLNESVLTVRRVDGSTAQWMTADQARGILRGRRASVDVFQAVLLFSGFASILGYFATWWFLRNLGSGSQENQRLRGAKEVVTQSELDKRIRAEGGGTYKLVDVALPRSAPTGGILVEGAQGSGKSLAIHDLMLQVFAKRRKSIIYDESGEYFRAYFRPGKDVFFNPARTGTVGWSLFNELRYTYDADSLGQALLPQDAMQSAGSGGFFMDAARALFSAILLRLSQAGATNTRDIAAAILSMPAEEMSHLIRDTVAHSSVGGDSKQQRQGVISSIAVYLSGIAAVPAGDWTFRKILQVDDDARLFILNTEDTKAMFASLYRLMLTVAFGAIASKQELVKNDRLLRRGGHPERKPADHIDGEGPRRHRDEVLQHRAHAPGLRAVDAGADREPVGETGNGTVARNQALAPSLPQCCYADTVAAILHWSRRDRPSRPAILRCSWQMRCQRQSKFESPLAVGLGPQPR